MYKTNTFIDHYGNTHYHVVRIDEDGAAHHFPLTDDNPNKPAYDAWLAEGNVPEEWNPDAN